MSDDLCNIFVMKCNRSLSEGFTPLHAAVMSHNAVVKELRTLENPCLYTTMELEKRRQMYVECIKTLLLMGASFGRKVSTNTTGHHLTRIYLTLAYVMVPYTSN